MKCSLSSREADYLVKGTASKQMAWAQIGPLPFSWLWNLSKKWPDLSETKSPHPGREGCTGPCFWRVTLVATCLYST